MRSKNSVILCRIEYWYSILRTEHSQNISEEFVMPDLNIAPSLLKSLYLRQSAAFFHNLKNRPDHVLKRYQCRSSKITALGLKHRSLVLEVSLKYLLPTFLELQKFCNFVQNWILVFNSAHWTFSKYFRGICYAGLKHRSLVLEVSLK